MGYDVSFKVSSSRLHETEVGVEILEVGEDITELGVAEAEPFGHGRGVLIHAGGGDPIAASRVQRMSGQIDVWVWEGSIDFLAIECAAHDEMMTAPTVVRAATIAVIGSIKITGGKTGDAVSHVDGFQSILKALHRGADTAEEVGMIGKLRAMGVKSTCRHKEDLPRDAQWSLRLDHLGHGAELLTEPSVWNGGESRGASKRGIDRIRFYDGLVGEIRKSVFHEIGIFRIENVSKGRVAGDILGAGALAQAKHGRATGTWTEGEHGFADLEKVGAAQRNKHRDRGALLSADEGFRHARAPAGLVISSVHRAGARLPLHLLITVREKVLGDGRGAVAVVGHRGRSDERADIGHERGLASIVEITHP